MLVSEFGIGLFDKSVARVYDGRDPPHAIVNIQDAESAGIIGYVAGGTHP